MSRLPASTALSRIRKRLLQPVGEAWCHRCERDVETALIGRDVTSCRHGICLLGHPYEIATHKCGCGTFTLRTCICGGCEADPASGCLISEWHRRAGYSLAPDPLPDVAE